MPYFPPIPAEAVTSVNTEVGAVVLTTGDIAEDTNSNYVSDAELTVIGNTSGTNTGDQDLSGLVVKANNLSDLTSASTARTNLGVAIGSDVQAFATVLANTTASFTSAQETKLSGIATGATANSSDATLLDRANHTGTQTASTISDFSTATAATAAVTANTAKVTNQNHTGDATGSTALTIANDAVTYAKMQNVSATDKILGRSTAGAGDVEEIACTSAGRALIDDADASAQRTTLGLGTLATQSGTFSGTSSGTNTGDQTITLTGDTTGTGTGSFATTIASGAVSLAKMANMATSSLIYRKTAGTGVPEVNTLATLKTDLGLTGTNSGDQTITLTGNVTGTGTGSFAATIANDAVTYAKMQNISATDKILGRSTAGAGDPEEITCTATGRSILDDTSTSAVRTTLGLTIGTDVQAYNSALTNATSGTYTPTLTNVANLDSSTAIVTQYGRIGNFVTVSGQVNADATAAAGTTTQLRFSLPIASAFTQTYQLGGAGNPQSALSAPVYIYADTTNDAAIMEWRSQSTGNLAFYFTFSYLVL